MKTNRELITPAGHYFRFYHGMVMSPPDGMTGIDKGVAKMLVEFHDQIGVRMPGTAIRGLNPFLEEFFSNREPLSVNDFSDETFTQDCKIVTDGCAPYTPALLKALYCFVFEHGYGSFKVLNPSIINYNSVIKLVNAGFKPIIFSTAESTPRIDKWILWDGTRAYDFDFSQINTPMKTQALKTYIWTEPTPKLYSKRKMMPNFISFLNGISNEGLKVSVKDVMTFKNNLSRLSAPSAAVFSSTIRDFVRFIKVACGAEVSTLVLDAFSSEGTNAKPFKESYSAEQMKLIFEGMDAWIANTEGEMHDNYVLKKLIARIVNETPVRGENVQYLTLNCIEKAKGTDRYYLHYNPKNYTEDTIPLIPEVKALFDEAIELTSKYRKSGSEQAKYIFIYRRARGNSIDVVSAARTSVFINDVCKQLGLPQLGLKGVRNRFMDKVTRAIGAKGDVSKSFVEAASRHSANVHFQNYVDADIHKVCLNMYGITIGTTDLKGVVALTSPEATKANTVLNGRGHCTAASCEDKTLCDCLMCRRFKTTPDCIPFFEKELRALETRIYESTMEEERKFLTAMKALNLKYLVALYEKRKEMMEHADD